MDKRLLPVFNSGRSLLDSVLDDFECSFRSPLNPVKRKGEELPVGMYDTDTEYVITVSVPGVSKDNIDLSTDRGQLTVTATRSSSKKEEKGTLYFEELAVGTLTRKMTLPKGADADKISASLSNGILTIEIPKIATVKPKKIEIG